MTKRRHTDEEVISILKEKESGITITELCDRHNICRATIYKWRLKFGGLDTHAVRRLRALEEENVRLRKLLAEAKLDIAVLNDIIKIAYQVAAGHFFNSEGDTKSHSQ